MYDVRRVWQEAHFLAQCQVQLLKACTRSAGLARTAYKQGIGSPSARSHPRQKQLPLENTTSLPPRSVLAVLAFGLGQRV